MRYIKYLKSGGSMVVKKSNVKTKNKLTNKKTKEKKLKTKQVSKQKKETKAKKNATPNVKKQKSKSKLIEKVNTSKRNFENKKANVKNIKLNKDYKKDDIKQNFDEEEKDLPKEFEFKGKEKDLEKKLKEDEDLFIEEFDEDKDPEMPKDEDILAAEEFEEELNTKKTQGDIFEGVSLDDSVRMFLKEIGQYNLLTVTQERELAKQKQDAQNLLKKKKLNDHLPIDDYVKSKLTQEELKIVKRGEISQSRLIECNLRLVVSIAKKYYGHGLALQDLISEGSLGLTRGIEKFDYKMGYKLSTYVTWWIRQAVSRALADQSKTIRIPVHMVETINKLNKAKRTLITKLGCEPNVKQIAEEMKVPEERVEEIMQIAMDPISLDKPVGDEEDSIVADFIADQNVISPETNAEHIMLREQIASFLSTLKPRERRVLELRFGLVDDRARTLEEVGRELNVTRERIRQIEDKALRKLKYRAKDLQSLIK